MVLCSSFSLCVGLWSNGERVTSPVLLLFKWKLLSSCMMHTMSDAHCAHSATIAWYLPEEGGLHFADTYHTSLSELQLKKKDANATSTSMLVSDPGLGLSRLSCLLLSIGLPHWNSSKLCSPHVIWIQIRASLRWLADASTYTVRKVHATSELVDQAPVRAQRGQWEWVHGGFRHFIGF